MFAWVICFPSICSANARGQRLPMLNPFNNFGVCLTPSKKKNNHALHFNDKDSFWRWVAFSMRLTRILSSPWLIHQFKKKRGNYSKTYQSASFWDIVRAHLQPFIPRVLKDKKRKNEYQVHNSSSKVHWTRVSSVTLSVRISRDHALHQSVKFDLVTVPPEMFGQIPTWKVHVYPENKVWCYKLPQIKVIPSQMEQFSFSDHIFVWRIHFTVKFSWQYQTGVSRLTFSPH